jgi:Lipocalin-like domain
MKNIFVFAYIMLSFLSCKENNETKELLVGKWRGVRWTVGGKEVGRDAQTVHFEFMTDYNYSASYEGQGEKGTFRLSGSKLYTTADATNKIEKMVGIASITTDTFVMDMNRMGDAEQLILVKKN